MFQISTPLPCFTEKPISLRTELIFSITIMFQIMQFFEKFLHPDTIIQIRPSQTELIKAQV